MDSLPDPIPFDDNGEQRDIEAKQRARRIAQAPTKVVLFLMDHAQRSSASERGWELKEELPEDLDIAAVADDFEVVLTKSASELERYCKKIAVNILPSELQAIGQQVEDAAILVDPTRLARS